MVSVGSLFEQTMLGPNGTYQALRLLRRFLKDVYLIWAWRPCLSCDPDITNKQTDQADIRRKSLKMVDGWATEVLVY